MIFSDLVTEFFCFFLFNLSLPFTAEIKRQASPPQAYDEFVKDDLG